MQVPVTIIDIIIACFLFILFISFILLSYSSFENSTLHIAYDRPFAFAFVQSEQ